MQMLLRQVQLHALWPVDQPQTPACHPLFLNKTALMYMTKLEDMVVSQLAAPPSVPSLALPRSIKKQLDVLRWLHAHPPPSIPTKVEAFGTHNNEDWWAITIRLKKLTAAMEGQRGTWLGLALASHCFQEAITCCGRLQAAAFDAKKHDSPALAYILPAAIRTMDLQLGVHKEAGARFSELQPILQVWLQIDPHLSRLSMVLWYTHTSEVHPGVL